MNIYSWNVNGLRAIFGKNFLQFVEDEKPDILCLQETKIQMDQITEEHKNVGEYYSYFSCGVRKGYSGVGVYTKEEPISVQYGIGIDVYDREGRILILEYNEFTLFNIYFPNGQKDDERMQYKLDFYDALFEYINSLVDNGKKIVICGDYNTAHNEIDLKNPKQNENRSGFTPIEREYMDKVLGYGYVDTFRHFHRDKVQYSWWSYRFKARERNAGWRIDYHLVSNNFLNSVRDSYILDNVMGSDHCPVVIDLDV